jgi:DHA2 family multidrug resistance protein
MASSSFTPVPHRGLITIGIMLAVAMQAVDATIANVALPAMQGSLGAARDSISWVMTSYIVAGAIATPLTGWLAARYGTKELLAASTIIFTIASVACGLAQSLEQVVLFRIIQGLAGAPLMPLSQSVMLDINPREKHGSAMALWSASISTVQAIGPTLGGYLTEHYNWRWVFLINLPLGIIATVLVLAFMGRAQNHGTRRFDMLGFTALAVAVGATQLVLDRGVHKDWFNSREIVIETVVAGLAFWTFLVHCLTARHAFFDPKMLRDRNFVVGMLLAFTSSMVFIGSVYLTPVMLQQLYGFPAITAGLLMVPRVLGMILVMLLFGPVANRIDGRGIMVLGFLLIAVALYWMTGFSLTVPAGPFAWSGFILGLGLGCIMLPMTMMTFITLLADLRAEAAGHVALIRMFGLSVGVSITTNVLSASTQTVHAELAEHLPRALDWAHVPFYGMFFHDPPRLAAMLDAMVTRQASMVAYLDDFYLLLWMSVLIAPLALLFRPPRDPARGGKAPAGPLAAAGAD